jgi:hypothetical protein
MSNFNRGDTRLKETNLSGSTGAPVPSCHECRFQVTASGKK